MKLLGAVLALGVWPIAHLACAHATSGSGQPAAIDTGETRFAEEGTSDVGVVTAMHAIALEDSHVGEGLIKMLEADDQITGETPSLPPSSV